MPRDSRCGRVRNTDTSVDAESLSTLGRIRLFASGVSSRVNLRAINVCASGEKHVSTSRHCWAALCASGGWCCLTVRGSRKSEASTKRSRPPQRGQARDVEPKRSPHLPATWGGSIRRDCSDHLNGIDILELVEWLARHFRAKGQCLRFLVQQDGLIHGDRTSSIAGICGPITAPTSANGAPEYRAISRQLVLFCVERRKAWRMLQSRAGIENREYKAQRALLADVDAGKISQEHFFAVLAGRSVTHKGPSVNRRARKRENPVNGSYRPSRARSATKASTFAASASGQARTRSSGICGRS